MARIDSDITGRLRSSGLRPTRQRVALARILFATGHRHVTAEELFREAHEAGFRLSLATVYNTLHQFTDAGLLNEVVVGSGQSWFDTNLTSHCHYVDSETGRVTDVPDETVEFVRVPEAPPGKVIERIDVVVRVRNVA